MWLAAANVGFTGTGAFLYWIARRRLLVQDRVTGRNQELLACALVSLLALGGFGLAHVGMNYSWTGRVLVTDLQWLSYALISAGLLFSAHALLRLQRSRADQLVLPVAAFLAVLGLLNTYTWETRDANAYISTVALPALRDYRGSIAESRSLSPSEKAEILGTLRPVPNELDYERGSGRRFATVLDAGWLEAYNASVRRFEAARAEHPGQVPSLPVREVRLYDGLRKQLLAAGLGFLLVPLVLFAISRAPPARLAGTRLPVLGAGSFLLAIVGATLLTSGDRSLPALLRLGGHSLTVYELLKLGLVVVLALSLAGASKGGREARFGFGAAGVTIAAMVWRDTGAGIALLAVAVLMTTLVADRRWRYSLVVAGALVLSAAPAAVRSLESHLPQTVRVRIGMWTDPWGAYQRAEVENDVTRALARIVGYRSRERVAAAGPGGSTGFSRARAGRLRSSRGATRSRSSSCWRRRASGPIWAASARRHPGTECSRSELASATRSAGSKQAPTALEPSSSGRTRAPRPILGQTGSAPTWARSLRTTSSSSEACSRSGREARSAWASGSAGRRPCRV